MIPKTVEKLLKSLLATIPMLSLLACQKEPGKPTPEISGTESMTEIKHPAPPIPESQELNRFQNSILVESINSFSLDFFQELSPESSKNLISSPLSAAMALSMTYNGASKSTAEAMAQTLKIQRLSLEELNQLYLILRKQLAQNSEVELSLVNGLWGKTGLNFDPVFLKNNTRYFGAEIAEIDFTAPTASQLINQWVKEQTRHKISDLIKPDDFSPLTILVLINAIYFKGLWSQPFALKNTRPQKFTHSDQSTSNIATMHLKGKLAYLKEAEFQAIALPYGQEQQNLRMYLFRPNDSLTLNHWIKNVKSDDLDLWLKDFREQEGSLALPRFKTEFEMDLKKLLSDLGMGIAFDSNQADFSAMLAQGGDAYLSKVRQKAFIEVNETGTEASAATSVQVNLRSMPVDTPFNLKFDRPFFYLIREEATGTILFMGSIERPEY